VLWPSPPFLQARLRVRAEVSVASESFAIPAVPDLIPEGPWAKVPGGVCAAKGFKATGGLNRAHLRAHGTMPM
jgi:glutamate N-acetyltransferase/amino-acid N-acetyltransferase